MEALERTELLRDHERRMIGEHDPARADADRARVGRDMGDEHARGRRRDHRHIVVFGVPHAAVASASARCASATLPAKASRGDCPEPMKARSRIERGRAWGVVGPAGVRAGGPSDLGRLRGPTTRSVAGSDGDAPPRGAPRRKPTSRRRDRYPHGGRLTTPVAGEHALPTLYLHSWVPCVTETTTLFAPFPDGPQNC